MASPVQITRETVGALLSKYVEMGRMRREDAAHPGQDRRADMAALAERFPGALRELDELPLPVIDARAEELRGVLAAMDGGAGDVPTWVAYFVAYHGWLRAALRIRRMCHGVHDPHQAHARIKATYVPAADEPLLSHFDLMALAEVRKPIRGRLSSWAYVRVAEAFSTSSEEVQRTLHPPRSLACP